MWMVHYFLTTFCAFLSISIGIVLYGGEKKQNIQRRLFCRKEGGGKAAFINN